MFIPGVFNVTDLQVFNKVGGVYSLNSITQALAVNNTNDGIFMVDLNVSDYTLFGQPNSMFEIKFPSQDIEVQIA